MGRNNSFGAVISPRFFVFVLTTLFLFTGIVIHVLPAQQLGSVAYFHAITNRDGLSQSENAYVFRDSDGFVWISSVEGLNRFDGRRVKNYNSNLEQPGSLYGANIQSNFFEDVNQDIWFTTDRAINCYRKKQGIFEHFFVRNNAVEYRDSLYQAFYFDESNSDLWVVASDDIFKFNTQTLQSHYVKSSKAIRFGLQKDKTTGVTRLFSCYWSVMEGLGIDVWQSDGGLQKSQICFEKDSPNNRKLTVRQVLIENDSIVWVVADKSLLRINTRREIGGHEIYCIPGGGCDAPLRFARLIPKQGLYVSTATGELWRFSFHSKTFRKQRPLLAEGGEVVDKIRELNFTKDSVLWCSVRNEGVFFSKVSEETIATPVFEAGLPPMRTTQIFCVGTSVWCVGEDGRVLVFSCDNRYKLQGSFTVQPFSKIVRHGDEWLAVSMQGVESYSAAGRKKQVWNRSISKSSPICVAPFSGNAYYIGVSERLILLKIENEKIDTTVVFNDGIFRALVDSNKRLWAYDGYQIGIYSCDVPTAPRRIHVIANVGVVNHIFEDIKTGRVFIATSYGLRIIDNNTFEETPVFGKDFLPAQFFYAIATDKRGNIWLSSNKGIVKYMPQRSEREQFDLFAFQGEVVSNEYCPGAVWTANDGTIWFGSTKGVAAFHPKTIKHTGAAPQLAIVGLKIHEHDWSGEQSIETATRIELEHNQNTLRLELAAMEYTDPSMNKFRVRLLNNGSDTSWMDIGTQNFITYPNLRPGNYRFQFKACNAEGVWQETPRSLEIVIHPHFTDTLWFKILLITSVLAFIGFFIAAYFRYQLRAQQLELEKQQREAERERLILENELSLQQERNRIADEMHDELGGGLSTIRLASQRAKRITSPEELQGILGRVSQISIGLVNNMRGIIWAMDSQNDSLVSLLAYIRQYAGTFLDDNAIAATLRLPEDYPDRPLSSHYRHSVMLTVKECLNNILKHANASAVEVSVNIGDELCILIRDNGLGFDPEAHVGKGKGLRTTQKRMESIGGSVLWLRNPDSGMTVTLCAPLPAFSEEQMLAPRSSNLAADNNAAD